MYQAGIEYVLRLHNDAVPFTALALSGVHKFLKSLEKPTSAFRVPEWLTSSKFQTEDPEISGATVQNVVARTTWRPGFVYPWVM
jgi:hypothetical protein